MLATFQEHLYEHLGFLKGKTVLLGISGGLDSVVLTDLLYRSKVSLSLAHCNFKLRGEASDQDEQFVKTLAEKRGIPLVYTSFDTNQYADKQGISIQMAARELRYKWFEKMRREIDADYILTAHHKDDLLETFLINLIRGTGLDGLTGIPEVNGNIVRPLLPFSREDIAAYAQEQQLLWREDQSNHSVHYTRNKLRHQVIPVLKSINPGLLEGFEKTLEHLKDSQQIISDALGEVRTSSVETQGEVQHINCKKISALSRPKAYLYELLKEKGFTAWKDVAGLLTAQTGKQVFSNTHRLLKNREVLVLSENKTHPVDKPIQINQALREITHPLSLQFEQVTITPGQSDSELSKWLHDQTNCTCLDAAKLCFPLHLRKWQKGDYFYPLGMKGKKKLSKYFKDEKMSMLDKENTWCLYSGSDLVWIVGRRMDKRFKVTEKTSRIFKISH